MFLQSFIALSALIVSVQSNTQTVFTGFERISLNASRKDQIWTVSGVNESTGLEIRVPARVPGGIYTDLEENGILTSPIYHEYNDLDSKWVGRTNWTYTRTFTVTQSILEKRSVVLVCEGLDTIANVMINDISVGHSENMFVRYIYDIKSALRVGQNSITVAFQSPVEYAEKEYTKHEEVYGYPIRPEAAYQGEHKVQMIRKMQSSFAWDWGPSYPNSGIWKDIYIDAYNGAVIRDVLIFTTPSKPIPDETPSTHWTVTAKVYYDCAKTSKVILKFHRLYQREGATEIVDLAAGIGNFVNITLKESGTNTKLWWPNGYGRQNLYSYTVSLSEGGLVEESIKTIRIGFRTVELVEDFVNSSVTEMGREFYVRVNGIKMYSKGSNSIPIHVLPERITEKQTEWLLRAAKMSHQNMIRVWGGGLYESDTFFQWADEYGILIWEDFMFACALYPATKEFLENVEQEVETQVKRLQYHPSLALWAGNNENEGGLRGGWFGFSYQRNYFSDYRKLYISTIKSLLRELDPSRSYLPSSPTNGKATEEEDWIAQNPGDLLYGDIHAYNYYSDNWNWNIYKRARYSSEYGYQSYPHYETLAEVADNMTQWSWGSPKLKHRQRHRGGKYELENMIQTHFFFPTKPDSPEALPYMLYLVQLTQIMGQKTQTEFYRRLQDKMNDLDGTGHNMGALYWQLNDIWQGCSWSSIEVNGRWKLQMYYAQKFFAPVLASLFQEENEDVSVELISDSREIFTETLTVKIYKLDRNDTTPIYEQRTLVKAEFLTSKEVHRIDKSTLEELGCIPDSAPCIVYTVLPGTPDNFLFLQYPTIKKFIPDPKLEVTSVLEVGDGKTIRFRITTQTVAPFVFLTMRDVHYGYFSDNGFIQVTPQKEMTYYAEDGITISQFQNGLQVMSLYNVTQNSNEE